METNRRVLIVEEDCDVAAGVAAVLAGLFGWSVRVVREESMVAPAIDDFQPCAVILDLGAVEDLVGCVTEVMARPGTKLVLTTASSHVPAAIHALLPPASLILTKPFTIEALAAAIGECEIWDRPPRTHPH